MIGEGIETVLSASKLFQYKPVWSVIDAGDLQRFPVAVGIEAVTIAVDNDPAGRDAACEVHAATFRGWHRSNYRADQQGE